MLRQDFGEGGILHPWAPGFVLDHDRKTLMPKTTLNVNGLGCSTNYVTPTSAPMEQSESINSGVVFDARRILISTCGQPCAFDAITHSTIQPFTSTNCHNIDWLLAASPVALHPKSQFEVSKHYAARRRWQLLKPAHSRRFSPKAGSQKSNVSF